MMAGPDREIAARETELRAALVDAHDRLLGRDEEIERLQEEVAPLREVAHRRQEEIERLESELVRVRVRLDGILASRPMRIYHALTRLPLIRGLRERRRARYERALARRNPD